jgi:hypothetical protein
MGVTAEAERRRAGTGAREEVRFAGDSPLEGDGFELSVPRSRKSDSFDGGEAPKGHGDDMRRYRDAEYLKRNRGFESDFLQQRLRFITETASVGRRRHPDR